MLVRRKRCCPEDQNAAIVSMRPGKDPWFVSGDTTIHFEQSLPDNCAKFQLKSVGVSARNQTKVVILKRGDTINLPGGSKLKFLRFKGTRALLAICYKSGSVACRVAKKDQLR